MNNHNEYHEDNLGPGSLEETHCSNENGILHHEREFLLNEKVDELTEIVKVYNLRFEELEQTQSVQNDRINNLQGFMRNQNCAEHSENMDDNNEQASNEKYKTLSNSTFSFIAVSKPGSVGWVVGLAVWVFQIAIYFLLVGDLLLRRIYYGLEYIPTEIPLHIPAMVSSFVSASELLAMFIVALMQDDMYVATDKMSLLRNDDAYNKFMIDVQGNHTNAAARSWWKTVGLYFVSMFTEGLFGLLVSCIVILQSDTIMGLFKDFAALVLISELDELIFDLASINHFGRKLEAVSKKVESIQILKKVSEKSKSNKSCRIPSYRRAQIASFFVLLGFWSTVKYYQLSGIWIKRKYPHCAFKDNTFEEWLKLGNNQCDTDYNVATCSFDGGDCDGFNLFYPDCDADRAYKVGDGRCDQMYNTRRCRYDGYDCYREVFNKSECDDSKLNVDFLGNGICDSGLYNTEGCYFDGGDCDEYNKKFPHCNVLYPHFLNDGICHHENILTEEERDNPVFLRAVLTNPSLYISQQCRLDGGDCLNYMLPDCIVNNTDWLADNYCHNYSPYNTEACGWDGGDCLLHNFLYGNCDHPFPEGIGAKCYYELNKPECNFSNGKCVNSTEYSECNSSVPPLMSRGYCRPECGYDETNSNCIHFEDKYPLCNASDLTLIGNGICDNHKEYNTAECGYEDFDCVGVSLDCKVRRPEWIGDGICHAGVDPALNTTACGWDGGDCVEANSKGLVYNCSIGIPFDTIGKEILLIGDDICHANIHPNVNTTDCAYDGGDCLKQPNHSVYDAFFEKYPNCSVIVPDYLFDNRCVLDGFDFLEGLGFDDSLLKPLAAPYNTSDCGYDNGECIN